MSSTSERMELDGASYDTRGVIRVSEGGVKFSSYPVLVYLLLRQEVEDRLFQVFYLRVP